MTMVTKENLEALILKSPEHAERTIGRALVVVFKNQTQDERVANTTRVHNGRGFTPADARSGGITAKYFLKHGKLLPWQIEKWMRRNAAGDMRISKYWRQLDAAAREKASADAT